MSEPAFRGTRTIVRKIQPYWRAASRGPAVDHRGVHHRDISEPESEDPVSRTAATLGRFAERFVRLTDADVRRLVDWTRAIQCDQPESGREWRAAVSRELNSIQPHPAEVAHRAALASLTRLIEEDARTAAAAQALDVLVEQLIDATHKPIHLEWSGKRRALWMIWFGVISLIAGVALIAAAIGVGLGGRRELMSILALIAFALIAVGFGPYVVMPLLPPTDGEARTALSVAIVTTALVELLPADDYALLITPWQRTMEVVGPISPPRRWKAAIVTGRLLVAGITFGAGAFLAAGFLQQLGP